MCRSDGAAASTRELMCFKEERDGFQEMFASWFRMRGLEASKIVFEVCFFFFFFFGKDSFVSLCFLFLIYFIQDVHSFILLYSLLFFIAYSFIFSSASTLVFMKENEEDIERKREGSGSEEKEEE